jgi:hypothetical protein
LHVPQNNVTYAYYHSTGGQDWSSWSTAAVCNITGGGGAPPPPPPNQAFVLEGALNSINVVASRSTEMTPGLTCNWVQAQGLVGGVNANYFKSDGSPVGLAGNTTGDVTDYGCGTDCATKTFIIDSAGNGQIVASASIINPATLRIAVSGRELAYNPGIHHRTGLGIRGNRLLLFVVPDATPEQFILFAASLGLNDTTALQLDGGGSSAMCSGSTALFGNTRPVPVNIGLRSGAVTTRTAP